MMSTPTDDIDAIKNALHKRCYQAGERHSLPDETSHFLQVDVIDDLEKAITQAEAQEAKAPISWRDIKVTKGQETHTLGTLIELLEYERDTALASLKSQEAKAIGEQTPVVIKDSEVFTACETYADNYLIEGRITTSPKAMRMALKKFMEGRSPMSSEARDKAIENLDDVIWDAENCDWTCENCGRDFGIKETDLYNSAKKAISAIRG